MKNGTKPLMTPLRRVDKGIKDDPQFSPYFPSHRYIVFQDYGHPTELAANTFRTKAEALAWVEGERARHRPGEPGTDVLGKPFTCDGRDHLREGLIRAVCLTLVNFAEEGVKFLGLPSVAHLRAAGVNVTLREVVQDPVKTITSRGTEVRGTRTRVRDRFTNSPRAPEVCRFYGETEGFGPEGNMGYDPYDPALRQAAAEPSGCGPHLRP